ncbi:hypothetical protein BB559_004432 [Furculomyces boomerangus]|uniref:VHS domain-containing protein n=1 Tax=Furculomyces boomerangus TaxID=61424 RepID=A0A2T9YES2_9FUNG|nr:hypothetical protein BB559_004432 [Furculomyces boomerangus]
MSFNLQRTLEDLLKPPTHLQKLIDQVCSPERTRPDLYLNLEICDYVNTKKGNNPHEAVFSLVPYINSRIQRQALLALDLLDSLVKNCGHAVHFQIASKDFLNSLVRRFPEFQPNYPNPVQNKILEMLQEWRYTLCVNSRHKEDLYRIKDMCNLLKRKHWRLPEPKTDNTAIILGPQNMVKSQTELEKEDLEAMQAKLQELLRRATPQDLREANKLMKIITGYERPSKKFDYDKQFSDELDGLETKAGLLKDMLLCLESNDRLDETGQELLAICVSNIKKIGDMAANYKEALDDLEVDETNTESEEYSIYMRLKNLHDLLVEVIRASNDIDRGVKPSFSETEAVNDSLIQLEDNGGDNEFNTTDSNQTVIKEKPKNLIDELMDLNFMASILSGPEPKPIGGNTNTYLQTYQQTSGNLLNRPATMQPYSTSNVGSDRNSTTINMLNGSANYNYNSSVGAGSVQASQPSDGKVKSNDPFDFGDILNSNYTSSKPLGSNRAASESQSNERGGGASGSSVKASDSTNLIDF